MKKKPVQKAQDVNEVPKWLSQTQYVALKNMLMSIYQDAPLPGHVEYERARRALPPEMKEKADRAKVLGREASALDAEVSKAVNKIRDEIANKRREFRATVKETLELLPFNNVTLEQVQALAAEARTIK